MIPSFDTAKAEYHAALFAQHRDLIREQVAKTIKAKMGRRGVAFAGSEALWLQEELRSLGYKLTHSAHGFTFLDLSL